MCQICGSNLPSRISLFDHRHESYIEVCAGCGVGKTQRKFNQIGSEIQNYRFSHLGELIFFINRYSRVFYLRGLNLRGIPSIADWGCGRGDFLSLLTRWNSNPFGVEYSEETAREARGRGFKVYSFSQELSQLIQERKNSSDVVFAFHCLEHTENPAEMVTLFEKILTESGTIIIEVPNFDSIQRKISGQHWNGFDSKNHYYHFTPSSLEFLLNQSGFGVKKQSTFSFEYGVTMLFFSIVRKMFFGNFDLFNSFLSEKSEKSFRFKKIVGLALLPVFFPIGVISVALEVLFSFIGKGGVVRFRITRVPRIID